MGIATVVGCGAGRWRASGPLAMINRAGPAGVASATGVLSDPAAHWLSAAIISVDLVGGVNGATAGEVTHDPAIAAWVSLRGSRRDKAQHGDGREKEQDFFHDGELGYGEFDEARFPLFKTPLNIFSAFARFLK